MDARPESRICFVGDSFVAGYGDRQALGWVGRVMARALAAGHDITGYNLGVRRDTSADIAARWQKECAVRLSPTSQCRVVFSFGANDTAERSGSRRITEHESLQHLEDILQHAKQTYDLRVIGPAPVGDAAHNERTRALCNQFQTVCASAAVSYLPVFDALLERRIWVQQAVANDGAHPDTEGYAMLADQIIAWRDWWFAEIAQ